MSARPITRRAWLAGAAALAASARTARAAGYAVMMPIVFAHGNGDSAALWLTTVWRFESNGWPAERLHAFNFTDPLARADDGEPQPGRSSSADQKRELAEHLLAAREGFDKVALVASSRGGNAVRSVCADPALAPFVSHAVLCGTPAHGTSDWEANPRSEFNARSPFLRALNGGEREVPASVPFLTLRSDGNDKFAQADGRLLGRPGVPTGTGPEGPALAGALNLVLPGLDHREVAFHPRAFREIHRFLAGAPTRHTIAPEAAPVLDGLVTGFPGGVPTNRPLIDATVEVWRCEAETGTRIGPPLLRRITAADGRWGPVQVRPDWPIEFVLTAPGHPATHIYRSPFPRSSRIVHLRPARPLDRRDDGCTVLMSRPRGYFGMPRDLVLFDGRAPRDVTPGVPTDSVSTLRLPEADAGRPVAAEFEGERIVARAWPAAEGRIVVAELTY